MKVVILVKQVPATDRVKMDEETGTMIRDGVEAELNPLDLYAVTEAVKIKAEVGDAAETIVLSLGPRMAEEAIRHAIALGCDKGYLLSDKRFAGSDVWATAYALSLGVRAIAGDFDLILCGERAIDGETGQVGPEVATYLGIPVLTYVSRIDEIGNGKIIVHRAIEGGYEVLEAPTPALVSVVKAINEPQMPTLKGKMKAKKTKITILSAEDIGAESDKIGLKGSATRVVKIFRPKLSRRGQVISSAEDLDASVDRLIRFLVEKGAV